MTVGWIGSILLALCGLPQAIQSYKTKSSAGISSAFLTMWFLGEVLTLSYIIEQSGLKPLILNYSLNIVFILVIIYYKVFGNE